MRALSRPHALPLALPHLSPAVTLQVAFADRILLNKLDLVTAEEVVEVEAKLREINKAEPDLPQSGLGLGLGLGPGTRSIAPQWRSQRPATAILNSSHSLTPTLTLKPNPGPNPHCLGASQGVQIVHCERCQVDPKLLIGIKGFSLDRVLEMDEEFLAPDAEHVHDERITSISFKFEGDLNLGLLNKWIGELMRGHSEPSPSP